MAAARREVVEQLDRSRRRSGGLIAVGRNGELALPSNSRGLYPRPLVAPASGGRMGAKRRRGACRMAGL